MSDIPQYVEDVEFICSEIVKFLQMDIESLRAHWQAGAPFEALCMITHPSGRGSLYIGKKGYQRFYTIADRFLSADANRKARVSADLLANALRKEFVTRFLTKEVEIDETSVGALLDAAWNAVDASCDARIYYIPCSLIEEGEPSEFVLGPVTFTKSRLFLANHREEIEHEKATISDERARRRKDFDSRRQHANESANGQPDDLAELLFGNVEKFFGSYDWIAAVKIGRADPEISEIKANAVVQGALDILKLVMGPTHSNLLGLANTKVPSHKTGALFRNSQGRLEPSMSLPSVQNTVGKDWFKYVTQNCAEYYRTAEDLLRKLADFWKPAGVSARFFDSLHWYGDAVVERSEAAALTKYVFALERATPLRKKFKLPNSKGRVLGNRAAVFWKEQPEPLWEWTDRIQAIYRERSHLVHGSLSPFDADPSPLIDAAKVTRMLLLGMLQLMHFRGYELADDDVVRMFDDLQCRAYLNGWPWVVSLNSE